MRAKPSKEGSGTSIDMVLSYWLVLRGLRPLETSNIDGSLDLKLFEQRYSNIT